MDIGEIVQEEGGMRFKKACRMCDEMFRPIGRDYKLCDNCRRVRMEEGWAKIREFHGCTKG